MSASPATGTVTTAQPNPRFDPGEVGLTAFEADRVRGLLAREPNALEWAMFGAMWSEHCAYKHSKRLLRSLPSAGERVAVGPGENAGAVDLGDGLLCVFKLESHNHPSAVEPYQGAATGVGGILRDIFAMGARPIAVLNALFFGAPRSPRTRGLVRGVVGGISFYGNCVGIPDVAGHVSFEPCFEDNPLVNAMCVGLVRRDALLSAATARPGSAVYLVGSDTGRDGIAGASLLASFELGSGDAAKRPSVQVGNPFLEKLLLEATLELASADAVEAVQDLGAAGLTCAASEVAAKSGVGMRVDIARVPRRAAGMLPFEVMLSESQERMLVVARPGREADVERVFAHWELHGVRIGDVTREPMLEIRDGERLVASLPPRTLTDDAPEYDLSTIIAGSAKVGGGLDVASVGDARARQWSGAEVEGGGARIDEGGSPAHGGGSDSGPGRGSPDRGEARGPDRGNVGAAALAAAGLENVERGERGNVGAAALEAAAGIEKLEKAGDILLKVLASPAVASRRVLYRTYDQMVGTDTVVGPGGDAAVMRIKGRPDGIAVALDAQPRVAAIDPFVGAAAAVAEATRNIVCMGATPLAITDCLNLGNPERPRGAYELERTVAGIAAACAALGTPVVSGNVSLYNATSQRDIWPAAAIGAVGQLRDVTSHLPVTSGRPGDLVLLAGSAAVEIGTSAYGALHGIHRGPVAIDLALEARLQRFVLAACDARLLRAAHDRAEGGLVTALAELVLRDGVGMRATLPTIRGVSRLAALFGEGPSGIVLVVPPEAEEALRPLAATHDVPLWTIGQVGGDLLEIAPLVGLPIDALRRAYEGGLAEALGRASASRAEPS